MALAAVTLPPWTCIGGALSLMQQRTGRGPSLLECVSAGAQLCPWCITCIKSPVICVVHAGPALRPRSLPRIPASEGVRALPDL